MKKLNKLFAILVAMAMVLSLTVISAFAEGNPNAQDETTVKITKKVTKAAGLTLPETTFTFTVAPESYDGNDSQTTKDAML